MPYAKIKLNGLTNVNAHQILPCLSHQKQAKTPLLCIRKAPNIIKNARAKSHNEVAPICVYA